MIRWFVAKDEKKFSRNKFNDFIGARKVDKI